jgi:hypothetical protein
MPSRGIGGEYSLRLEIRYAGPLFNLCDIFHLFSRTGPSLRIRSENSYDLVTIRVFAGFAAMERIL